MKIKTFGELTIGDIFRFPGGVTEFIKTPLGCCVNGNPDKYTSPSDWEDVVPTGEWSSIAPPLHLT